MNALRPRSPAAGPRRQLLAPHAGAHTHSGGFHLAVEVIGYATGASDSCARASPHLSTRRSVTVPHIWVSELATRREGNDPKSDMMIPPGCPPPWIARARQTSAGGTYSGVRRARAWSSGLSPTGRCCGFMVSLRLAGHEGRSETIRPSCRPASTGTPCGTTERRWDEAADPSLNVVA